MTTSTSNAPTGEQLRAELASTPPTPAPAAPEALLAASAPTPQGTSEWQLVSVEFTVGPKTEAVLVRIVRVPCAEGVCPIYGKIWYDDFNLERADGRATAR